MMNKSGWQERLQTGPFRTNTFSQKHIQGIESRLQSRLIKKSGRMPARIGILGAIVLLVVLIWIIPLPFFADKLAGSSRILDTSTPEKLARVAPVGNQFVLDTMNDNMSRGYGELFKGAVIDPDYYKTNPVQRGDIVCFDGSAVNSRLSELTLSRVVGLPGETVRVRKGQIYINGNRLDTFYGRALAGGLDRKAFLRLPDNPNLYKENILKDVYDFSMDEIVIPEGTVFLVGDNWLRSLDSLLLGPVSQHLVKGKVIGVGN